MPDFNPTQTGKRPDGQSYPIPISGTVFRTSTPLTAPNVTPTNKVATPIFSTEGFSGMGFIFNSDQPGYYTIEYFMDDQGLSLVVPMITVDYKGGDLRLRRKGAIDPDGQFARITFYNMGTAAQTVFFMAVVLKVTPFQPSLEILGAQGADSRFAMWCKSFIHIKDKDGAYGDVNRTGDALNTYVVNQPTDYAKEGTDATSATQLAGGTGIRGWLSTIAQSLINGLSRVQVVNGSNQTYGSTTTPFNVTLPATPTQNLANIDSDLGSPSDAAVTDPTASGSVIGLLKGLLLESQAPAKAGTVVAITIPASLTQSIAADANRKQVIISSSSGTFLIGCGFTPTANNWTYRIITNGIVEIPPLLSQLAITVSSTQGSTGAFTLAV